jgi:glycosyltransferase involved in cell wall biosynthesis
MKPKYLVNGFKHVYDSISKFNSKYDYEFLFPKGSRWDVFTDYALLRKYIKNGLLKKYSVIHINTWENILQYNPDKHKFLGQITIAEAHGFFVGLNFDATIRELPIEKKIPNKIIKLLFDSKMRKRLKQYDIFYVSTPNMLEHAKKIRKDALWLPNPIDTKVFRPNGPKLRMDGNPSVFLPTRLHAFKNPLFGIRLFKKIKSRYPDAKLHMINYGHGADPLFNTFKKLVDEKDVIYHNKMPKEELAKLYRSADLVLGQFNPVYYNFSMVELEAILCGAPIVTLERYEIGKEFSKLEKLEALAFKLITDKKFKDKFIKRNSEYVLRTHSEKAVAEKNIKNITNIQKLSE